MTEPIKIFRGDDTDFIGNKVIEITLDTDIDLSGITADFLLCGFKQHFDSATVATKRLEVVISHEETKRFPLGRQLGTLVLKSADGKIKHVDTQIEFFVTNKTGFPMFCGDEQIKTRFGLKIKWDDIRDTPTTLEGYGITDAVKSVNGKFPDENGNVEVEGGGGGTSDYNDLNNKPSINSVTLSGNKTAADLGLATAAQGAKADSAYKKPQAGIPASDMAQAVQTSLGKADGAVQKSGDTMTGGLTVPTLTVGSRAESSIVGDHSTAEGYGTTASGSYSHAEGNSTTAEGDYSHAEGVLTTASGEHSHAEGERTTAYRYASHAEGYGTTAKGDYSHAEGRGTKAQNTVEHAQGQYNASHTGNTAAEQTLQSVGFGSSGNDRKNAVETMQDGKTFIYGVGGYDGTNPTDAQDLATVVNGKLDAEAVADAYDATSTYAVGDLVTHDGRLYECNTAISSPEDWNAMHWTEKKVGAGGNFSPLTGREFDFATTQGVMDALKATIEALGGTVIHAPTPPAQNNQTQGE